MIRIFMLFIAVGFLACNRDTTNSKNEDRLKTIESDNQIVPEFQSIIDSAQLKGVILVYDYKNGKYLSNDFERANEGHLPASTFKIANTIIALESGVVDSDTTDLKWDGEKRAFKQWEQDLLLKDAFQLSCVPCYREIARKVGIERMQDYLENLDYGNMDVNTKNLDIFWLEGNSKISAFEQIDFLKRLYLSKLPVSEQTESIVKEILLIETTESHVMRAKTGWSIQNGTNNGWYVGYLEKHDNVYFFAINIEPSLQFNMDRFPIIRKEVCHKALKELQLIN